MTNIQTSRIGTPRYYSEITRNTVFSKIRVFDNKGFGNTLAEVSNLASQMLRVMYEDVERNKETIRFLEKNNVQRIEKFADNLLEAARFTNVFPRSWVGLWPVNKSRVYNYG